MFLQRNSQAFAEFKQNIEPRLSTYYPAAAPNAQLPELQCLKSLQLSGWNPPPANRRFMGALFFHGCVRIYDICMRMKLLYNTPLYSYLSLCCRRHSVSGSGDHGEQDAVHLRDRVGLLCQSGVWFVRSLSHLLFFVIFLTHINQLSHSYGVILKLQCYSYSYFHFNLYCFARLTFFLCANLSCFFPLLSSSGSRRASRSTPTRTAICTSNTRSSLCCER